MKYRVLVTRDVTESALIDVDAASKGLAADRAIEIANGTIESAFETRWSTNDIGCAPAYLGDCVEEDVSEIEDSERKTKHVLVSVRCANDFVDGVPQVFYSEIPYYLVVRIKELAAAVGKYRVYAIEEFNYNGIWSEDYFDENEIDTSNWRLYLKNIEKMSSRVDIPEIRVTQTVFYWTAVPKHAGDSLALKTNAVPITYLDSVDEIYFDI